MQLRQPEALGVFDHHDAGVGYVYADLDDRGRNEHIDLAALKAAHDDLLLVGVESPMQQPEPQAAQVGAPQVLVHLCRRLQRRLLEERGFFSGFFAAFFAADFFAGFVSSSGSGSAKSNSGWSSFGSFDDRIDNVGLMAAAHLLANDPPHILGALV